MDKQTILNLLDEKRRLTAPVSAAWRNYQQEKARYDKAMTRFSGTIKVLLGLAAFLLLGVIFFGQTEAMESVIFLAVLAGGFFGLRIWLANPREKDMEAAKAVYDQERSQPAYIEGGKEFPQKFYNYNDCYRLYKLVEEGRALTLQDAYNLLETQQFQETQLSIQEEMQALQQDIARSSRAAAVSGIVTAVNTYQINKKL